MRFWNGRLLAGDMIESTGKSNKEDCMNLCLSKSECVSFNYHVAGICYLYGAPLENYLPESEPFSAGVRCNISFEPTPADGKYPAVVSTPGET